MSYILLSWLDITTLQPLSTPSHRHHRLLLQTTISQHSLPSAVCTHRSMKYHLSAYTQSPQGRRGTDFFIDLVKQSKCSSTMMATPRLTQIEELRTVRDVGVGGGVGWRVVSHLIITAQDYNIIKIYTTIRLHHNKYIQGKGILDKFLHMSTSPVYTA